MRGTQEAYDDFARQLDYFGRKVVPQQHLHFQREIVCRFFFLVAYQNMEMIMHPRDTGWAQRNWRVSVHAPQNNVLGEKTDTPMPRPRTQGDIRSQMSHIKPFQRVWVYNNVPYMGHLEDGHSGAAPVGIVAPALHQLEYEYPMI